MKKIIGTEAAIPLSPLKEVDRQARIRLEILDREIIALGISLIDELTRTVEGVKDPQNGPSVNSLGALQGNGPALDRLIGERRQVMEFLKVLGK